MTSDLSPAAVAERLARLRASWRPMTAAEARARLVAPRAESFEVAVARRLRELRALIELTAHLHGVRLERA
jgi:hypothetical protein